MENRTESRQSDGREALHKGEPSANPSTTTSTGNRRKQAPWLSLTLDAYVKAERARRASRIADALGSPLVAKCARIRMFRHRAIAYHLEQAMNHETT
jgi:uncharacterized protein HemY